MPDSSRAGGAAARKVVFSDPPFAPPNVYNTHSRILGSVYQRATQQYGTDIKLAVAIPPNASPAERGSIVDAAKVAGAGEVDLVDSIHALVEVYTYVSCSYVWCLWCDHYSLPVGETLCKLERISATCSLLKWDIDAHALHLCS